MQQMLETAPEKNGIANPSEIMYFGINTGPMPNHRGEVPVTRNRTQASHRFGRRWLRDQEAAMPHLAFICVHMGIRELERIGLRVQLMNRC
jgi:hypothetical protein